MAELSRDYMGMDTESDDFPASVLTRGAVETGWLDFGVISQAGDADWFKVSLTAGEQYRFQIEAGSINGLFDPQLAVFNYAGQPLAQATTGQGFDSKYIDFTPATTADYFLAASGDGVLTGSYELWVPAGITAGSGSHVVTGTSGNDTLTGSIDNDTLTGGEGSDTAVFGSAHSGYSLSLGTDGTLTVSGADGTDTLTGIEQLQFADGTLSLGDALPVQLTMPTKHYAKVEAYFLGILGREATADEASQFAAILQANQSRVWWNADQSTLMGTDSLMGYLMNQAGYTTLTANDTATIVETVYHNLTGQAAPQALIDQYVGRLGAGTLQVQGVANKLLGELYLSPKGDNTLGTVAGFADNRAYLDGTAYRGFLDHLDAVAGVDIANLDANGNLVVIGVAG